jgi:hypothetical protein
VRLRQHLAVHGHREHRVPAVQDRVGGHPDGHPVHVAHDDLVRAPVDARLAQDGRQQRALPPGVAE